MIRRTVVLVVHGLALLLALLTAPAASAYALRDPQVPVMTNRLQSFLDGVGESIRVDTDQLDAQSLAVTDPPSCMMYLELAVDPVGVDSIGVYNASEPSPRRMCVFPEEASAGWFAVLTFRSAPERLEVFVFDQVSNLRGIVTYLGADRSNFGFWMQGPGRTFSSQDHRNPGGAAQMLVFGGSGFRLGDEWLCLEAQPVGAGSDQDFDDGVIIVAETCGDAVRPSTWGALKRRFR